jgi:hypothetical protein
MQKKNLDLRRWAPLGLCLGMTLWTYLWGGVLQGELLGWDDAQNLYENPHFKSHELGPFWTGPYYGLFAPITYSFWYLAWRLHDLFGTQVPLGTWFHGLNLIGHLLNTALVYGWILKLLQRSAPQPRKALPAALAALIFSLHPLQMDTIAWASGFRDILSTTFGLLYLQTAAPLLSPTWNLTWLTLALLAKPSGVLLPWIGLLLRQLLFTDTPSPVSAKNQKLTTLLSLCLSLPIPWMTWNAQSFGHIPEVPWSYRPALMLYSGSFYLGHTLWPYGLRLDYQNSINDLIPLLGDPSLRLLAAVILAILGWSLWIWKAKISPLVLSALGLSLGLWLPISGIVAFAFQNAACASNHYGYFPLVGLAIGAAWAAEKLEQQRRPRRLPAFWVGAYGASLLLLGSYVPEHLRRIPLWKDTATFFSAILKDNPNHAPALNGLGVIAFDNNRLEEARRYLKRTHELRPWEAPSLANYVFTLARLKDHKVLLGEIYPEWTQSLHESTGVIPESRPFVVPITEILVESLWQAGRHREARQLFQEFRSKVYFDYPWETFAGYEKIIKE